MPKIELNACRESSTGGAHLRPDVMPLLQYFVTIGALLTAGLFALSTYLDPAASEAKARVSVAPTTASLIALAPSPVKPAQIKSSEVDVAPPAPVKPSHVKVSHKSR
jgi:hypothetical protein